MEEFINSQSNLTIDDTGELLRAQFYKYLEAQDFIDNELRKIQRYHEIQKSNFLLLEIKLHSLKRDFTALDLVHPEAQSVTEIESAMTEVKKSVGKIKELSFSEREIFEYVNGDANDFYHSYLQLFLSYQQKLLERWWIGRELGSLSIFNDSWNQQTSNSRSIDQLLHGNCGAIIQHTDPHLVADFGANILSKRLGPVDSSPSDIGTAPSWTKDGTCCVVCLEGFGPEGAFVLGTCGHVYHNPCLARYSRRTKSCYCGAQLPLEYFFSIGETIYDENMVIDDSV